MISLHSSCFSLFFIGTFRFKFSGFRYAKILVRCMDKLCPRGADTYSQNGKVIHTRAIPGSIPIRENRFSTSNDFANLKIK